MMAALHVRQKQQTFIRAQRPGVDMPLPFPTTRIPPLPPAEWTEEVRDFFSIMEGPDAREHGSKFNIILTFANHPLMTGAFNNYYKTFLSNSTLSLRLREIVTLRVAWRHKSLYEWTQHVAIAKTAGLTDQHIAAIQEDADNPVWSELERYAIQAVDELGARSRIEDATWDGLCRHLDRKQVMELPFIIGSYTLLCYAVNSMGVQLETR
jgi:4-carboxymuconolactone decarboxylase